MKNSIIAVVALILIGAGAWYISSGKLSPKATVANVVAVVNGEEITRSELDSFQAQVSSERGFDLATLDEETRSELSTYALDSLISQALIRQAIKNSNIQVAESDIDAQIEIVKSRFASTAEYESALATEGMTEAELRFQITSDLSAQAYFEAKLGLLQITATDAEINTVYDQAAAGEDVPPLTEVRAQVETMVIQQKQQELIAAHIQELRTTANIEVQI